MAALAGVVIVPLLLLGIIQAIYRQSVSMLLRSVVVNVPLALLLTGGGRQAGPAGAGGDRRHERRPWPRVPASTPAISWPR